MKINISRIKRLLSRHRNILIGKIKNYNKKDSLFHGSLKKIVLSDENTFFGYYDKDPFNKISSHLLLLQTNHSNPEKNPNKRLKSEIGIYNIGEGRITEIIDSTYAWNWQQGARLHWFNEESLIYNYYCDEKDKVVSKVHNMNSKSSFEYPIPVQESIDGRYILSINYGLLNKTAPEYGYKCIKQPEESNQIRIYDCDKDLILWEIDEAQVIEKLFDETLYDNKSTHFNHLMASPDGENFIGLFRYYKKRKKNHVLLKFNLQRKSINILLKNEVVSHYTWKNNDEIIFWGKVNSKPGYYKLNVITKELLLLCEERYDGHPNMMDSDTILTDTYPLEGRRKSLYYLNLKNCKKEIIGTFFEPTYCHGDNRCDLHPRLSHDKRFISIDTMQDNRRMMKIIDLQNEKKKDCYSYSAKR